MTKALLILALLLTGCATRPVQSVLNVPEAMLVIPAEPEPPISSAGQVVTQREIAKYITDLKEYARGLAEQLRQIATLQEPK